MKRNCNLNYCISLIILFLTLNISWAQKPAGNNSLQIIPDETEISITKNNMRTNQSTGVPIALYKPNYLVNADTPEKMARQFLAENYELLKLSADLSELKYFITRETPGGYHVHFDQYIGEYPVLNSRINVTISRDNRVVFVTNGSKINYNIKVVNDLEKINISSEQALNIAKNHLELHGSVAFEKANPVFIITKERSD